MGVNGYLPKRRWRSSPAPVLAERRVPGGAAIELWVHGEAELEIPLPTGVAKGELYFQGSTLGTFGEPITTECRDGLLRFKASNQWPQKHLYFVAR